MDENLDRFLHISSSTIVYSLAVVALLGMISAGMNHLQNNVADSNNRITVVEDRSSYGANGLYEEQDELVYNGDKFNTEVSSGHKTIVETKGTENVTLASAYTEILNLPDSVREVDFCGISLVNRPDKLGPDDKTVDHNINIAWCVQHGQEDEIYKKLSMAGVMPEGQNVILHRIYTVVTDTASSDGRMDHTTGHKLPTGAITKITYKKSTTT